jgi:outer membrane protein OmpA-like peptidoglycan-associated protein
MRTTLPCLGAAVLLSISVTAFAQGGPEEEPTPPSMSGPPNAGAAPAEGVRATMEPGAPPADTSLPDSMLPSLMGPIGLYHMSTAEVGPVNHLRFALHGQYFRDTNFLISGDTDTRVDGVLSFGYTPHEYIELFGAILTSSNRNQRAAEANRRDPELIKSFGDLVLGGKTVLPLGAGSSLGGELGLRFLSSISDLSFSPGSTSFWIGPLYTLDLRPAAQVPLRFHLNANFYLDNSKGLIDLSSTTPATHEVAMFAYSIAASRLRFAVGADMPLEKLTAPVPLQPFVEYHAEVITASADPAFMNQPNDTRNRDQQWLTFGLRARIYRGVTLDAGTDVRLRSVGFQYGPPIPTYDVLFGLNYGLDIDAFRRPVVVTKTVEKTIPAPVPEEGRIAGVVKDAKDGKPIAGAIVAIKDRPRSRVATDPDGSFVTGPLPPGPAELEVSAPNYDGDKARAVVAVGPRPVELAVALNAKVQTGNVRGRVLDAQGHGVDATIRFAGAEAFETKADTSGSFSASLPVGPYKVTAEAVGVGKKDAPLDIATGQDRQLDIVIRPPNPDVAVDGDAITLKQPIKFKSADSTKLEPKVQGELDGVAELLSDHPEIRTLRIEAHWDASAGTKGKEITNKQAGLVKDYLVKKGVPEGRVEAVGMGSDKPLVPNIGPANKAKNRRVELHTTP